MQFRSIMLLKLKSKLTGITTRFIKRICITAICLSNSLKNTPKSPHKPYLIIIWLIYEIKLFYKFVRNKHTLK